jgi:hypothetical protein
MHIHTRLRRPVDRPAAASPLDALIDALAACELPTSQHLSHRDRRKYHERPHWKSILRRIVKETSGTE